MADGGFGGPSARDIAQMLRPHAEPLGRMIFPNAVRAGKFLCVGSINGEPGDSLKIHLHGPKQGGWSDYGLAPGQPGASGDMLTLIEQVLCGGDIKRAIQYAKQYLSIDSMDPRALRKARDHAEAAQRKAERARADDTEKRRRDAEGMWMGAARLTPSSPPVRYLEARGIDFGFLGKLPGAIRWRSDIWHAESGRPLPCMLTKIQLPCGKHVATHQTFLQLTAAGWRKVPPIEQVDEATGEVKTVQCAKKIFGPAWEYGGHMALWKGAHAGKLADLPVGVSVEVSEGIEDGLSYAMADPAARVIAAGTLGLLGQMHVPPQVRQLNYLAQHDTKEQAIARREESIKQLYDRARAEGVERVIACRWPKQGHKDWNDWLMAEVA